MLPLGKSPAITDDHSLIHANRVITVAESGAIVEYLIDQYGEVRFKPAIGTPERLRYTYWLHYAEGSAMPPLLMKLKFDEVEKAPMPFFYQAHRQSDFGQGQKRVHQPANQAAPGLHGS